jgi:hypothetical protein
MLVSRLGVRKDPHPHDDRPANRRIGLCCEILPRRTQVGGSTGTRLRWPVPDDALDPDGNGVGGWGCILSIFGLYPYLTTG